MIIKGTSRTGPSGLAAHLGNAASNERVTLLETRGTVARDLRGALIEMDAYAAGTRCQKPLYHANIDPQPPHRLTAAQCSKAIDALEEKLGLVGHQRVVVLHEKHGREHIHVVWTRIDIDHMKSVSDSHNYRKHEEVARALEREFGHARIQGAHAQRYGRPRPDRSPSRSELRQEERTGISGRQVKLEISAYFKASDGPGAFRAAIEEKGYILARGDRRDYVIVDRKGGIHSLARRLDGVNVAQLSDYVAPLARQGIPSLAVAQEITEERQRKLAEAEKAKGDAKLEKTFSHGADYVTQTRAALREHMRRQAELDEIAKAKGYAPRARQVNAAAAELRDHVPPLARQGAPPAAVPQKLSDERQRKLAEAEKMTGDAKLEKTFSHGAGNVTETRAIPREHMQRQTQLDEIAEAKGYAPDQKRSRPAQS